MMIAGIPRDFDMTATWETRLALFYDYSSYFLEINSATSEAPDALRQRSPVPLFSAWDWCAHALCPEGFAECGVSILYVQKFCPYYLIVN
jgi:hypothetical protein